MSAEISSEKIFDTIIDNIKAWDISDEELEEKYGFSTDTIFESVNVLKNITKDIETSYDKTFQLGCGLMQGEFDDSICDSFYEMDSLIDTSFSYISYTLHSLVPKEVYRGVRDSLLNARKSTSCNEKVNSLRYFLKILLEIHFSVIESFCRNLKRVIESFVPENPSWNEFVSLLKSDVVCFAAAMEPNSSEEYQIVYDSITDRQQPIFLTVNLKIMVDHNRRIIKMSLLAIDSDETNKLKEAMQELFDL